jgi:hypothetical protein
VIVSERGECAGFEDSNLQARFVHVDRLGLSAEVAWNETDTDNDCQNSRPQPREFHRTSARFAAPIHLRWPIARPRLHLAKSVDVLSVALQILVRAMKPEGEASELAGIAGSQALAV